MSEAENAPGTFCWIELSTSDGPAAKQFYSQLFGWSGDDSPIGPDMVYTMLRQEGKDVGALFTDSRGTPPHWLSYIAVGSADETAARARELGATVMAEPFDVMSHGRMAVLQDPQGAIFAIWEPRQHRGLTAYGVPGALCWNELAARDAESAGSFYAALFGWTRKESNVGMPYTEFHQGERAIGGMYTLTPEMSGMPPSWQIYFAVDDCNATAAKAEALGATIHVQPTDIPNTGRFSLLADPQGAFFSIIRLERAVN